MNNEKPKIITNGFAHGLIAALLSLRTSPPEGTHKNRGNNPGAGHCPPGSKFLRRAFKAAIGRRGTYKEAVDWYRKLKDGEYKAGHRRSITGQPLKFS